MSDIKSLIKNSSNHSPLLSVVTVTYNAEQFLEQTIKSVIEQNYKFIEYIIIDGASSDNTIKIINQYEQSIDYWISEPDKGIYDAMNKAISIAKGEWINFLNAGDQYTANDTVSDVFEQLKESSILICGGTNSVDGTQQLQYQEKALDLSHIWKKMLCSHQAMFVKTELMKKHNFNIHYQYSADVDFFMKLSLSDDNFQIIDKYIINFLIDGCSQENHTKAHLEVLDIISKKIPRIEDLYQHTSFEALFMGSKESPTFNSNLFFSKMYNRMLIQLEEISQKYNNIALYGAGHISQQIQTVLGNKIIHIVDKNYEELDNPKVLSPQTLSSITFDCILICALGREKQVRDYLKNELSIPAKIIIEFNLFSK